MLATVPRRSPSVSTTGSPFFLVGRDPDGHWLAVETHGLGGGLFTSRDAALGYVRREAGSDGAAFRIAEAPIELAFPARRVSAPDH